MERTEQTLRLLGPLSVSARPESISSGSLAIISHDTPAEVTGLRPFTTLVPLRNENGHVDLLLHISTTYEIEQDISGRSAWSVRQSSYIFAISDCLGRWIFSFHFHPDGKSWHTGFHAHAETAAPVSLHRSGNANAITREVFCHKVHIPTPEFHIEDLVELLRDDFGVRLTERDPRRVDRLLAANRAARSTSD